MQKSFNQWVFACEFRISHPFQLRNEMTYSCDISRRDICESIRFILAFLLSVNIWNENQFRRESVSCNLCVADLIRTVDWVKGWRRNWRRKSSVAPLGQHPFMVDHDHIDTLIHSSIEEFPFFSGAQQSHSMFSGCVDWTIKWTDTSQTINTILSLTRVIKFHSLFLR